MCHNCNIEQFHFVLYDTKNIWAKHNNVTSCKCALIAFHKSDFTEFTPERHLTSDKRHEADASWITRKRVI